MGKYWNDGFSDYEVEGGVEISENYYHELLGGQSAGKMIIEDAIGYPILADPPQPSKEENARRRIAQLKCYLKSSDWCSNKCYDMGLKIQDEYPDTYIKRVEAREEINELEKLL